MRREEEVNPPVPDTHGRPTRLNLRLCHDRRCRFPAEESIPPAELAWAASKLLTPCDCPFALGYHE